MRKEEEAFKAEMKNALERMKLRGIFLKLKRKQLELEQRYRERVSDEEWQEYCRSKKRIRKEIEERYNKYHDPRNGRFTSGNSSTNVLGYSGAGGLLVVDKGHKGKGFLVGVSDSDMAEDELQKNFGLWEKTKKILTRPTKSDRMKGEKIARSSISECENFPELETTLKEKYNIELDTKLKKHDFECVKQASLGVTSVIDQYPDVSEDIVKITTTRRRVYGEYSAREKSVRISPSLLKDNQAAQAELSTVKGSYSNLCVASIGAHEAGHALEHTILAKTPSGPFVRDVHEDKTYAWNSSRTAAGIVIQAAENAKKTGWGKGKGTQTLRGTISDYSLQSYGETFAEAIADVYANGEKANPFSLEIAKLAGVEYENVRYNKRLV